MKFLVVDDVALIRRLLCQVLGTLGYDDVIEAEDGEEALAKMERERVDCVLTDWTMPKINGLALTKEIRAHPDYRDLPVIMITSNALPDQLRDALRADVTDYIVKPFTLDVLRGKIRALAKARAESNAYSPFLQAGTQA